MDHLEKFRATLDTYRKHGWQLARVLMTTKTLEALRRTQTEATQQVAQPHADAQANAHADAQEAPPTFEGAQVFASDLDAMWFRRASAEGREAWELRLAAEPYALFELFEPDEAEEDREDVRRELEARMREK